jgi:Fe-S oxidoreductase
MNTKELTHRCFRCGFCKLSTNLYDFNCPSYLKYRFESFSPGGRLWLIDAWRRGEVEMSERLLTVMFSCAMCGNCSNACGIPVIRENISDIIIDARAEIVEKGRLPRSVRDCLTDIMRTGNAFKMLQSDRESWTKEVEIERFSGQEYLFYVGDAGAFDTTTMTREVVSLLQREGLSFGILGREERDDGNDVKTLGERDLFEEMVRDNIRIFRAHGVKKIITLSPHAYYTMKNDYPQWGSEFHVFHYTQIIAGLIREKRYQHPQKTVTVYQEPCYLGRGSGEFFAVRDILNAIAGLDLVELKKNKTNALCCGGGGGNYYTDILGSGENSPSRTIIRNARTLGVDSVIVACPICYRMMDDAIKDEGQEEDIVVKDIAQILNECTDELYCRKYTGFL